MAGVHGTTQRLAPEAGGLVHIGGLAVDQQGAETGMVQIRALCELVEFMVREFHGTEANA
jgi:hypothetical protein